MSTQECLAMTSVHCFGWCFSPTMPRWPLYPRRMQRLGWMFASAAGIESPAAHDCRCGRLITNPCVLSNTSQHLYGGHTYTCGP